MDGTTAVQLTAGEMAFNIIVFVASLAISLAFAYYLMTEPARLDQVWEWSRSLPLVVQGLVWLLFLPWMGALWVWTSPWMLAARFTVVGGTLLFTNWLMFPWKA